MWQIIRQRLGNIILRHYQIQSVRELRDISCLVLTEPRKEIMSTKPSSRVN